MKDLDHAHIYEPAIHLMSTYVVHAVAWLVQNGLPSLSQGHSGAVMLGKISYTSCKGNLTDLRRILHLSLAKGNPK
jgi:hypothetical protein